MPTRTGDGYFPPPVVEDVRERLLLETTAVLCEPNYAVKEVFATFAPCPCAAMMELQYRPTTTLGYCCRQHLLADALHGVDDVAATDLGDQRVVVAKRKRNRHQLFNIRPVLAAKLGGHRVVHAVQVPRTWVF